GTVLGSRYKDTAVLWYVGGDSAPGGDGDTWVAMAKGLKEGSDGTQLVSYHGSGGTTSSTWYHKADWLDFNSIQSGHGLGAKTYRYIAKDISLSPASRPWIWSLPTRTIRLGPSRRASMPIRCGRGRTGRCWRAPPGTVTAPWTCSTPTRRPMGRSRATAINRGDARWPTKARRRWD